MENKTEKLDFDLSKVDLWPFAKDQYCCEKWYRLQHECRVKGNKLYVPWKWEVEADGTIVTTCREISFADCPFCHEKFAYEEAE